MSYTENPYLVGINTMHADEVLAETERWAAGLPGTQYILAAATDPDLKRFYLTWLTNHARQERLLIEEMYQNRGSSQAEILIPGSWFLQRNVYGMNTCQIASAINALHFLGVCDPSLHTEERFVETLGAFQGMSGMQFARANPRGTERDKILRALQVLAPGVSIRRTNSLFEMLRSANAGAAVMFSYSSDHEALIPPGFQLNKSQPGDLQVQVVDSLSTDPKFLSIGRLVKSEITTVFNPDLEDNAVLIIERVDSGIRTIGQLPNQITTVPQTRIRTLSH